MLEQQLFNQVLHLPPTSRAILADKILESLEHPDSEILQQWAEEAESRIKAYNKGLIKATPAAEVFAKYKLK